MFGRSLDVRDRYVVTEGLFYGTFEVAPIGDIPHRYGCKDDAEHHPLKQADGIDTLVAGCSLSELDISRLLWVVYPRAPKTGANWLSFAWCSAMVVDGT